MKPLELLKRHILKMISDMMSMIGHGVSISNLQFQHVKDKFWERDVMTPYAKTSFPVAYRDVEIWIWLANKKINAKFVGNWRAANDIALIRRTMAQQLKITQHMKIIPGNTRNMQPDVEIPVVESIADGPVDPVVVVESVEDMEENFGVKVTEGEAPGTMVADMKLSVEIPVDVEAVPLDLPEEVKKTLPKPEPTEAEGEFVLIKGIVGEGKTTARGKRSGLIIYDERQDIDDCPDAPTEKPKPRRKYTKKAKLETPKSGEKPEKSRRKSQKPKKSKKSKKSKGKKRGVNSLLPPIK